MAAEHDVRHVFEDDAELPLVVVAVLHGTFARNALAIHDEVVVEMLPDILGHASNIISGRRGEEVAAVAAHLRHHILGPRMAKHTRDGTPALVHLAQIAGHPPLLVRDALVEVRRPLLHIRRATFSGV